MIDQSLLHEIIDYNRETGLFTWIAKRRGIVSGSIAGSIRQDNCTSYVEIQVYGKRYMAHRLAWLYVYGSLPLGEIDHIDGNGLNNVFSNLRDVSPNDNKRNKKKGRNNTSGVMGVQWHKKRQKWRVTIGDGRDIYLGEFQNFDDALTARKLAEQRLNYHENHGRLR